MVITLDTILAVLKQGAQFTIIAGLVYMVYLLISGKVVPRWVFDHEVQTRKRVEQDCETFKSLAYRGTELVERSLKASMPVPPTTENKP